MPHFTSQLCAPVQQFHQLSIDGIYLFTELVKGQWLL